MSWLSRLFRRPAATSAPVTAPLVRGRAAIAPERSPYTLPNELSEMQRLDLQHYMLRDLLAGNYIAPIQRPRRILDVGCGTGRWPYEIALQFPAATVVGVDIVAPKRPYHDENEPSVPNYTFQIANILEGLPFPDAHFDFVHMRLLTIGIPEARWPDVFREATRVLAPNGWLESIEFLTASGAGAALDRSYGWFADLMGRRGVNLDMGPRIQEYLRAQGLRDVSERILTIPIGPNGGKLGMMMAMDILLAVQGTKDFFIASGVADAATVEATARQMEADFHDPRYSGIQPNYVVIGQKPA